MALTFTVAGLQTALNAIQSASSWSAKWSAFDDYALTYAGLVESVTIDGTATQFPHPDVLRAALEASQKRQEARADRRRLGKLGVRHGS